MDLWSIRQWIVVDVDVVVGVGVGVASAVVIVVIVGVMEHVVRYFAS